MTKVKKTKKPKARKAIKKPVTKAKKAEATVRKIDKRLQPTPQPKVESIDKRINKPMLISDIPRSLLPQNQYPLQMFSGQDTGSILSKQFDVLTSREQQLESKFLDLKNELEKEKKEKKDLEHFSEIQGLGQRVENYRNNVGDEDIVELNNEIKQLLKDKTLDSTNRDLLLDLRIYAKESIKQDIEKTFKEVKSTNTLLDDKIHNNNLVDEAEIIMEEIKGTKIKGPVILPNLEQAFLLGEIQSSKIKAPVILPTFEEAVEVIIKQKKPKGRPKKEKINELVEVKSTNTLLDDVIVDNILDDENYHFTIGSNKGVLRSELPNLYYLDEKTGKYEDKSQNRKYQFYTGGPEGFGYKLRENYVDPSTYLNIPSTFDKPEAKGLLP